MTFSVILPSVLDDIVIGAESWERLKTTAIGSFLRNILFLVITCTEHRRPMHSSIIPDMTSRSWLCFSFTHSFFSRVDALPHQQVYRPARFILFYFPVYLSFFHSFSLCVTCGADVACVLRVFSIETTSNDGRPCPNFSLSLFASHRKWNSNNNDLIIRRITYRRCVQRPCERGTALAGSCIPPRRKRRHSIIILFQSSLLSWARRSLFGLSRLIRPIRLTHHMSADRSLTCSSIRRPPTDSSSDLSPFFFLYGRDFSLSVFVSATL